LQHTQANTFEEVAAQSKAHGKAMFEAGDAEHLNAMKEMQVLMQTPGAMQEWFEAKKAEFDAL